MFDFTEKLQFQLYFKNSNAIFFTDTILMISRDLGNLVAKRQNYTCVVTEKKLTSLVISELNKRRASP